VSDLPVRHSSPGPLLVPLATLAIAAALGACGGEPGIRDERGTPTPWPPTVEAEISVDAGGAVLRKGVPYCGIGVNYVDAFWRHLANPADRTYERGFADLAANGVPFVRFAAGAYWPRELQLYQNDRAAYLGRLDDVVRSAEAHGIGLVPSLFWAYFAVPDLVGEPVNRWGDPASGTIQFMTQYTQDIVGRYRGSPAIWAWEFGNEFSLSVDLPNAADWRPPIVPDLGTPTTRSAEDDLTTQMILIAFQTFAAAVHALDDRPVTTGNSLPRPQAEQMRLTGEWGEQDTREEFHDSLQLVNPAPRYQIASIHVYANDVADPRFSWTHYPTFDELLELSSEAARQQGQALFVGEFGASDVLHGGHEAALQANLEIIESLVRNRVPLSALWVYDFSPQDGQGWNTTYTNSRGPILRAIQDANERFADGACAGP
jgi:hypothetical protein